MWHGAGFGCDTQRRPTATEPPCRVAFAAGARAADVVLVELALTPRERQRGLMGRTSLAPDRGMWFDFARSTQVSMWMKDTLIELDMLFIDDAYRIVHIEHRATPHSIAPRRAAVPVRYVLELAGGVARARELSTGTALELTCGATIRNAEP